ncbi:MAG: SH3 domain-containing protein [Pseudomonadota bacterium]
MPDAAAIAAATPEPGAWEPRLIGEPVLVSLVAPRGDDAEPAAEPEVAAEMLRVTGRVVNMRAGPSTSNAVIDALPQGTLAEAIGEAENGWREIRDVATGRTGWMSANFLEPS